MKISRQVTLVSDKWKGTLAAIKAYRQDKGLSERQLPHKIVNHSAGEIISAEGYTTNAIEAKWSVCKRWVRKKTGGRMPTHSDREKWRLLLGEFQYRSYHSRGNTLDDGHTFVLPIEQFWETLALYFSH